MADEANFLFLTLRCGERILREGCNGRIGFVELPRLACTLLSPTTLEVVSQNVCALKDNRLTLPFLAE